MEGPGDLFARERAARRGCGLAAALAGLALAAPATAQTVEEAARANMALGLQLCLDGGADRAAWAQSFRNAGFAERVERSSMNSDTTHYFSAPADTARVELYYGEMPESCSVNTAYLGVTDASRVLDRIVPPRFPGFLRKVEQGPPDPATGQPALCVRYEDPSNPIGLVIGAAPGANASTCIDNGSSSLYQSYRV